MTTKQLPWDEIKTPKSDYNVRKVSGSLSIPLYWGLDDEGRCLFILEMTGDHAEQFRKSYISIHGMEIDLRLLDMTKNQGLVVALESHVDRDLFYALCNTLISALKDVQESSTALSVAMTHIKRWKAFMAGKKLRVLSPEEVRGLFSELTFLRSLYSTQHDENEAMNAWCGPEGSHQDFIYSNIAVEVKSLSGKERNTVQISSEDQLEGLCDNLYMMIYRLSQSPESEHAMSLNELVGQVESELTDSEAIEHFSSKLAGYGYVHMNEYDEPKYVVSSKQAFHVRDEFPRLIRSRLPDGVVKVKYEIELEKLRQYECDTSRLWG